MESPQGAEYRIADGRPSISESAQSFGSVAASAGASQLGRSSRDFGEWNIVGGSPVAARSGSITVTQNIPRAEMYETGSISQLPGGSGANSGSFPASAIVM